MKIERTKNAKKSIAAGLIFKVAQMILPFFMRTVMLYYMGEEYLGLNGLFTSVLQVLNLAELGVGSAMVFSMYKPIAEDDTPRICALMRLYRTYYRVIGLVVAVAGVAIAPFIPKLIAGDVPKELNVYVLYFLNLGATVLSYWLFAYKNSLLQAHQRTDVSSIVGIITNILQYAIQLFVILYLKDYYLYLITVLAMQVVNNLVTAVLAGKMYPQYRPHGRLDPSEVREINGRVRDLFAGKVGQVVFRSVDTIVISAVLGLTVLGRYQSYFFIITSITGVVDIMMNAIIAGLGNSFLTETKEKNLEDLKKFAFLFLWLGGVCACLLIGMYQPFMEIWVGKEKMLPYGIVLCLGLYFFIYALNKLLNVYKDAAGLWHVDRFRLLTAAAVNLILNILWVKPFGLYGILLSTVAAWVFVAIPWILHNIFTRLFERKDRGAVLTVLLGESAGAVLSAGLVVLATVFLKGSPWLRLLLGGAAGAVIPLAVTIFLCRKTQVFADSMRFADRLTKNKLHLHRRLCPKKRKEGGDL